jgi:hypothetical protein
MLRENPLSLGQTAATLHHVCFNLNYKTKLHITSTLITILTYQTNFQPYQIVRDFTSFFLGLSYRMRSDAFRVTAIPYRCCCSLFHSSFVVVTFEGLQVDQFH